MVNVVHLRIFPITSRTRVLLYKDTRHFAWYLASYAIESPARAQFSQQLFISQLNSTFPNMNIHGLVT